MRPPRGCPRSTSARPPRAAAWRHRAPPRLRARPPRLLCRGSAVLGSPSDIAIPAARRLFLARERRLREPQRRAGATSSRARTFAELRICDPVEPRPSASSATPTGPSAPGADRHGRARAWRRLLHAGLATPSSLQPAWRRARPPQPMAQWRHAPRPGLAASGALRAPQHGRRADRGGPRQAWSVSEVLGVLLPRLAADARLQGRIRRDLRRDLALHLFTSTAERTLEGRPDHPEQGRRVRAHERAEARARHVTALDSLVIAQHLDVAGAWFGRAGLVCPPDGDPSAPRRCARRRSARSSTTISSTIRAAREKHTVMMQPRTRAPASRPRRGRERGGRGARRGHPDGAHGPRLRRRGERHEDAPRPDVQRRDARGRHARSAQG